LKSFSGFVAEAVVFNSFPNPLEPEIPFDIEIAKEPGVL